MTTILKSRRASYVPGDKLRALTRATVDSEGRTWPSGTEYQPLCSGNAHVEVSIRSERVTFRG